MSDPNSQPFVLTPLRKANVIGRLFNHEPRYNAFLIVNNLLAEAGRPVEVSLEEIGRAIEGYRVNLIRDFKTDFENLYRRYLKHCLRDRSFTSEELEDLAHLKALVGLKDDAVSRIHEEVVSEVYSESLSNAINDGRLENDERAFLGHLKSSLVLSEEFAARLYTKIAEDIQQSNLKQAIEDKRLSLDESKEMDAIAKSLGVQVTLDGATMKQLNRYRLYWLIERGADRE